MLKRWHVVPTQDAVVTELQQSLGINKSICYMLTSRGISTYDAAQSFFRPSMDALHNPFLMKGMQAAVDRIIVAINNKEKILIYGDYDVDGTTAVAVVYNFLSNFTNNVAYYIPNRFAEGYGVSAAGIAHAQEQAIQLFITLDCGIKSSALLNPLQANGTDVIICDHHMPDVDIPNVLAILNPKQQDCYYPFDELCGCGIGYKLISALEYTMLHEQVLCNANLDLVATAIAADIVPIVNENRILAYYGLQQANSNPSIAIQALKQAADVTKNFTISDLVFTVAPRVNAAGRMDSARLAVDLFLSKELEHAYELATLLNVNNTDRKSVDEHITQEALEQLQTVPQHYMSTVLYKEDWHKGVVGIVASRMIENKYQPTIVLTKSNNKLTGSARSIPGLNLFEALNQCSDLLENYGGHYFAAGLTMVEENLDAFKTQFNTVVSNVLTPEDLKPIINIDAVINFTEINTTFYKIIEQMQPFGPLNMRPVFCTKNVTDKMQYSYIVKDKHLKFTGEQNGVTIKGIGFNMANAVHIINSGKPFDVCYTLDINTWQDRNTIELKLLDIRSSE